MTHVRTQNWKSGQSAALRSTARGYVDERFKRQWDDAKEAHWPLGAEAIDCAGFR